MVERMPKTPCGDLAAFNDADMSMMRGLRRCSIRPSVTTKSARSTGRSFLKKASSASCQAARWAREDSPSRATARSSRSTRSGRFDHTLTPTLLAQCLPSTRNPLQDQHIHHRDVHPTGRAGVRSSPVGELDAAGTTVRDGLQHAGIESVEPAEGVGPGGQQVGGEQQHDDLLAGARAEPAAHSRGEGALAGARRPVDHPEPGPAEPGRPVQQERRWPARPAGGRPASRHAVGAAASGQASTERRPENARPRVTSSAYSRSPPTGRPLASRVTDRSGKVRSSRLR